MSILEEETSLEGFANTFDVDKIYTDLKKLELLGKNIIEKRLIVSNKVRAKKHIHKYAEINRLFYLFGDTKPEISICVSKRCKHLRKCWNIRINKLRHHHKTFFKPFECLAEHFIKKEKENKRFLKKSSRYYSTLSNFEVSLIIASLRDLEIDRKTQIKEIISKLKYSDSIRLLK